MPAKPKPPPFIVTARLPAICPACGSPDIGKVDTFGIWRVTCQACGWNEQYRVVDRLPDEPRAIKGGDNLAFKKRHRVGPHR